ncbi:hypothetical protein Tco_0412151 [Tanacetum coccineum]
MPFQASFVLVASLKFLGPWLVVNFLFPISWLRDDAYSTRLVRDLPCNTEETERPRPTSTRSLLTLKPLPKIDPKNKGKKKIEEEDESDTKSEGIPEAEKKFKQLARGEEMSRKVQEDWEAEEEVKKLAEEEAIKTALSNEYDFIQARIEADRLLALRLQDEEREQFIVEERAKFLHDIITAQRRQAIYEKVKRFDESFIAVGSTKDERRIKEMNKGVKDPD